MHASPLTPSGGFRSQYIPSYFAPPRRYNPCTGCRDPLVVSLSEDGGETFLYTRVLEYEDGSQEFSYPTMRQDDGNIHVSYTYKRDAIKHSIVTEDWVMDPNQQYNASAAM